MKGRREGCREDIKNNRKYGGVMMIVSERLIQDSKQGCRGNSTGRREKKYWSSIRMDRKDNRSSRQVLYWEYGGGRRVVGEID